MGFPESGAWHWFPDRLALGSATGVAYPPPILARHAGKGRDMATKPRLTGLMYQDIVDLPEERRELLDGELIVPPSPSSGHQDAVGELYYRLRLYLEDR